MNEVIELPIIIEWTLAGGFAVLAVVVFTVGHVIIAELRDIRKDLQPADKQPGAVSHAAARQTQAPAHNSDVCQVLKQTRDGWEHHSWVRTGSNAWQEAYDTPGFAVKQMWPLSDIDYGKQ